MPSVIYGIKYLKLETLFTGKIQYFEAEIGSTNDWAAMAVKNLKVMEGTVFRAGSQHQGKGQRGRVWASEPNANLLVSYVFYPGFIPAHRQFVLVQLVSLALKSVLDEILIDEVKIKWPNDIYVNDLKIAGVLIESTMKGNSVGSSIFGIGLNVNQRIFENVPNATSIALETGKGLDLDRLLSDLSSQLESRYLSLRRDLDTLSLKYSEALFRKNQKCEYVIGGQTTLMTPIGVDQLGQIVLEDEYGRVNSYGFHEARMVI